MTDRPILFSAPMVRALLEGHKTQTRRVLKPQPVWSQGMNCDNLTYYSKAGKMLGSQSPQSPAAQAFAPHQVNDRLWVRENWRVGAWHYGNADIAVDYCDGPRKEWLHVDDEDMLCRLIDQSRIDADKAGVRLSDTSYWEYTWSPGQSPCRWRPSIHMPRWASRLTLVVTDVRVQRLQDIDEQDAKAEGYTNEIYATHASCWFRNLWDSLNEDRGFGWDANPWVTATTFTVHKHNIDI